MKIPQNAKLIIHRLQNAGFEAFAVGGCVRDSLLGFTPHDWDICTSAKPEQIKACFEDFNTIDIGIKHGTVAIIVDKEPFEVTTYRVDGEYRDNRHPESVTFTSNLREDLARRDFTVNAIAYNDEYGIADFYGGESDLRNRLIRCVGNPDERFREDALRIRRALRFASCYSFSIENKTAAAIHRNSELLNNIAAERIQSELVRLLCGDGAEDIFNGFRDVFAVFIPELAETFDFDQKNKHHRYDVFHHITHSVGLIESDPVLRLTMLFHDIAKPRVCTTDKHGSRHFKGHQLVSADIAREVLSRLRFPTDTIETCVTLIICHDVRFNGTLAQVKRVLNKIGVENMRRLFKVQYADTLSQSDYLRGEKLAKIDTAKAQFEQIMAENQCFSLKQLAVNGRDIIDMGVTGGKQIGRLLNLLLDSVIDGTLPNEKAALLAAAKEYSVKE